MRCDSTQVKARRRSKAVPVKVGESVTEGRWHAAQSALLDTAGQTAPADDQVHHARSMANLMQEAWLQQLRTSEDQSDSVRAPIMVALIGGRFATVAAYFFGGAVGASLSDTIASACANQQTADAGQIRQHLHTLRVLSNRGRHDEEIRERLRRGQSIDERGQALRTLAAPDNDAIFDTMLWVAEVAASNLHGSQWQQRQVCGSAGTARGMLGGDGPDHNHSHEAVQGYGAKAVLLCVFVFSWIMSSWLSILPVD